MSQCEVQGCDSTPDVRVKYEDPSESVKYCLTCGTFHFKDDQRAQSMEYL